MSQAADSITTTRSELVNDWVNAHQKYFTKSIPRPIPRDSYRGHPVPLNPESSSRQLETDTRQTGSRNLGPGSAHYYLSAPMTYECKSVTLPAPIVNPSFRISPDKPVFYYTTRTYL